MGATLQCSASQRPVRARLKNVKTPKRRVFRPHASPIFLEIHPGFLGKIVFAWRRNPSSLSMFPCFKQRLDDHLAEIDTQAEDMFFQLVKQLEEQADITGQDLSRIFSPKQIQFF